MYYRLYANHTPPPTCSYMKQIGPDGRLVLSPSPSPKDAPNHVGGGVVQLARTQEVGKVLDYGALVGANKNVQGIHNSHT